MAPMQPTSQPRSTGRTVLIVVVVLIALCVVCSLCVFVGLALSGPAVGNVFSSIVTGLPPTPTP